MTTTLSNEQKLRRALQLILDHGDYHIQRSCSPADSVVAAIPPDVLEYAHKALKETREHQ